MYVRVTKRRVYELKAREEGVLVADRERMAASLGMWSCNRSAAAPVATVTTADRFFLIDGCGELQCGKRF